MDMRTTRHPPTTTWASWSEYESNYNRSVRAGSLIVPIVSAVVILVFVIGFICIATYIRRRNAQYEWPRCRQVQHTGGRFIRQKRAFSIFIPSQCNDTVNTTVWSVDTVGDMDIDHVIRDLPPPYPGEDQPPAYSVACDMLTDNFGHGLYKYNSGTGQMKDNVVEPGNSHNINEPYLPPYTAQPIYHHSTSYPSRQVSDRYSSHLVSNSHVMMGQSAANTFERSTDSNYMSEYASDFDNHSDSNINPFDDDYSSNTARLENTLEDSANRDFFNGDSFDIASNRPARHLSVDEDSFSYASSLDNDSVQSASLYSFKENSFIGNSTSDLTDFQHSSQHCVPNQHSDPENSNSISSYSDHLDDIHLAIDRQMISGSDFRSDLSISSQERTVLEHADMRSEYSEV